MQKIKECTSALEGRVRDFEDNAIHLKEDVALLCSKTNTHSMKARDVRNRLRCSTLRFIVIPVHAEGTRQFIKSWLCNTFGTEDLSAQFVVEIADGVPSHLLSSGNCPRPFLIKLLNFN